MSGDGDQPPREESRDPRTGRPDYHDPVAGIGGAPSATSALTLRLLLAGFGFVVFLVAAVWLAVVDAPVPVVAAMTLLAAVALVDVIIVVRRKARGEPG